MSSSTTSGGDQLSPRQRVEAMLRTGRADRIPFAFCYFDPTGLFNKSPGTFLREELTRRFPQEGSYEWTLWDDAELNAWAHQQAMATLMEEYDWERCFFTRGGIHAWGRKLIVHQNRRYAIVNATDFRNPFEEHAWECREDGQIGNLPVKPHAPWRRGVEENKRNPQTAVELLQALPQRSARQLRDLGEVEHIRQLAGRLKERYMTVTWVPAPFWRNHHYETWGYAQLFTMLYDDPALVKQATEIHLYNAIEELKAAQWAGAEVVAIDEYFPSDDEIGLNHFLEFSLPATEKLIQEAKRLGLYVVFEYGGDALSRIDHFKDLPADAFWVEEASKQGPIDIGEVRRRLGDKKVLLGNLCNKDFLYKGTPAAVEEEVRRQIEVAGRHGYFMMSTGSASARAPIIENSLALLRATKESGRPQ